MAETKEYFKSCLYFTANNLSRNITRMAEEEFKPTGISPSHAFLQMAVNETRGISPKELAKQLKLAPSTVTRFLDHLEEIGYLSREFEGKSAMIYPTPKGIEIDALLKKCWKNLYEKYSVILGYKQGNELTRETYKAAKKLEKN